MTAVDALVTWLRAQLDDDERVAREAAPEDGKSWALDSDGDLYVTGGPGNGYFATGPWGSGIEDAVGEYIVRNQPAQRLAEVDAKRLILELHQPEPGQHPDFCGHDMHEMPCPTLRPLVLPYADRPGYLDEWRP